MLMEIDEIQVDAELWRRAKAGLPAALETLRNYVDGLKLFTHNMTDHPETIVITLRDLERANVLGSVRMKAMQP